jgi:hypothetical protein
VADLEGTSHAFVALERDMKYHLTTHTDNNRSKFSILETIKNARNRKRERRYREMFCLETACILMEASYQAYFPLPTPFNPRWNVNDVSDIKAPPIACGKTDNDPSNNRDNDNDKDEDKGRDNSAVEDNDHRDDKGIEVGASQCESPLNLSAHIAPESSQLKSERLPSSASSSSSVSMQGSDLTALPALPSLPLPLSLPLSASPCDVMADALELQDRDPSAAAVVNLISQSTVSTVNRAIEDTVALPGVSGSSHPLSLLAPLHQNHPATQDSMHPNLTDITGLQGVSDTVLLEKVSGQDPVESVAVASATVSSVVGGDGVHALKKPQPTASPPLPPSEAAAHGSLDDNRVFGPKMDLPRMGLKLLSSFENKEHATFGFVATTPRPASFYPLEGESRTE